MNLDLKRLDLPKIDLKTTIIASALLAGVLNLFQFTSSYLTQKNTAFVPPWLDSPATADGSPAPAKLAVVPRAAPPPTVTTPAQAGTPQAQTASVAAPAAPADSSSAAGLLTRAGLKPDYAGLYISVQARTGTPWQLLAAVHKVETGQSGNTARQSYAGATGPMQFMPGTFAHYALDGDGNGTKDITNLDDAMLTAGRYLAAGGAARGSYSAALYNYNHSSSYVSQVLAIARKLGL